VIDNPKSPVVASILRLLDIVAPHESDMPAAIASAQSAGDGDGKARFKLRRKGLGRNES
jgi:hypothetical protein